MDMNRCGEAVHPDGGNHYDEEKPLWAATLQACHQDPASSRGMACREIVQLLLQHGAQPNIFGKFEYYSGGGPSDDSCDSEVDAVDADGYRHTEYSRTTPLQLVAMIMEGSSDGDTIAGRSYVGWSLDVANILKA